MKDYFRGCLGCLGWFLMVILFMGACQYIKDYGKTDDEKKIEAKTARLANSCSFGKFTKQYYKIPQDNQKAYFEDKLRFENYKWCGVVIDAVETDEKNYIYITGFQSHFTGDDWKIFKKKYPKRTSFIIKLQVNDFLDSVYKGDYIIFEGKLIERGLFNVKKEKFRNWYMEEGEIKKITRNKTRKKLKTSLVKQEESEERQIDNLLDDDIEKSTKVEKTPTNFDNCTELNNYYPNGVKKGHPAYKAKMDRDGDGLACDK